MPFAGVLVLASTLAACGDAPPPVVDASKLEGAPLSGAPFRAPAPAEPPADTPPVVVEPSEPAARAVTATATATVKVDPAPTPEMPAIGDPSTPDERLPADDPVTMQPPQVPPTATPPQEGTPTSASEVAAEIPATTASQADKPSLPDKPAAQPAAPATAPAAAAADVSADPAAAAAAKSLVPKDRKKGVAIELTFEQLASFDFTPPPLPSVDPDVPAPDPAIALEAARKQIPAEIWELEGQLVSVEGYMIPLEYADEGVKAFLISRHAMGCCFGVMPRAHELVECDMGEGQSTPYVGYLPVKITGVLHVGPKEGPQAFLTGIYRMDAPKVTVPRD